MIASMLTCFNPTNSAGLAGLAITAALNLTGLMNWTVRQSTELEVQMNRCGLRTGRSMEGLLLCG